jgi:hypothetical protein
VVFRKTPFVRRNSESLTGNQGSLLRSLFSAIVTNFLRGENVASEEKFKTLNLKNRPLEQGCQMVCFPTKNPNLGKIFSVSDWKMLIYLVANLWTFEIFNDHLAHGVFIWYILRFWCRAPI